jgi:hypothetical protein
MMPAIADVSGWLMVLAPTLLSIVAAALYAGHREFQALRDRVARMEVKLDLVLQRVGVEPYGPGPSS